MSIKLSKNEKIIKSFDYATEGYHKKTSRFDTFKSLIVTNKRVIHEEVCERRAGKGTVIRNEMPVGDAKYLSTAVNKTSRPGFIVAAVIFALLAVIAFVLPSLNVIPEDVMEMIGTYLTIVGGMFALIALVCLLNYFASRKTLIMCRISSDHAVYPVMGFVSLSGEVNTDNDSNKKKKRKKESDQGKTLEIRVNAAVARELVDELGAVILDGVEYDPASEEVVEEVPAETEEIEAVADEEVFVEEAVEEATEEATEEAVEETAEEAPVAENAE